MDKLLNCGITLSTLRRIAARDAGAWANDSEWLESCAQSEIRARLAAIGYDGMTRDFDNALSTDMADFNQSN